MSALYRYRPFDAERDLDPSAKGYLADVLRRRRIFVPNATMLNDPWEFAPDLVPSGARSDLATQIARFLAFLAGTDKSEFKALVATIRSRGEEAVLQLMRDELFKRFRTYGVLSFSDRADLLLMWSYYAFGHNGYALAFNAKVLPFREATEVRYRRRHPRASLALRDMTGLAGEVLATKASEWRQEREWRLIVIPERAEDRLEFVSFREASAKGYYGRLPAEALTGIVLGDRLFNGPHGQAVIDLVRMYRSTLPIWHAAIDRHAFRIKVRAVP